MVRKGNLAKFESSKISETEEAMLTKIGVHACDINLYLHEFFGPILFDSIFSLPWTIAHAPWSEREIWPNLKVAKSLKQKRLCSLKLVCMHVTLIPTCMNFLSQFYLIQFFCYHGL